MTDRDLFAPLEQLAAAQDVHELGDLLYPARVAGRELHALKIHERKNYGPRLETLMRRVEANQVFTDPRAERALEVLADLCARLA